MLVGVDLVVTAASGGTEDGSPSFGSATDISAALREFSTPNRSIVVDTTTRTATLVTDRGIRAGRDVNVTIDVPDDGTPTFGTSVNTYWQFVVKYITSGSSETLSCKLRENEVSAPADGRQTQRCRFSVYAAS